MERSPERFGYEGLEAALRYRRLGLSVIPIPPPIIGDEKSGKRPSGPWKEWMRAPMSEGEIHHKFRDIESGVAIVCGKVSNVIAVDGDSEEAVNWIRRNLPTTPLISRTGKGQHHFYKWPGFTVPPGAKLRGMPLDLRGDGSYVIAPPSRHYTGKTYKWIFEPTEEVLNQLPPFDPDWLAVQRKFAEKSILVDPVESRLRVIRRAFKYVETMEPAVSGQGGHNQIFRVVCKLLKPEPEGFGLSESEAAPIIVAFNARCIPPFSDKDVEHKINSVLQKVRQSLGGAT